MVRIEKGGSFYRKILSDLRRRNFSHMRKLKERNVQRLKKKKHM